MVVKCLLLYLIFVHDVEPATDVASLEARSNGIKDAPDRVKLPWRERTLAGRVVKPDAADPRIALLAPPRQIKVLSSTAGQIVVGLKKVRSIADEGDVQGQGAAVQVMLQQYFGDT